MRGRADANALSSPRRRRPHLTKPVNVNTTPANIPIGHKPPRSSTAV